VSEGSFLPHGGANATFFEPGLDLTFQELK
jgi:hypothetical protein